MKNRSPKCSNRHIYRYPSISLKALAATCFLMSQVKSNAAIWRCHVSDYHTSLEGSTSASKTRLINWSPNSLQVFAIHPNCNSLKSWHDGRIYSLSRGFWTRLHRSTPPHQWVPQHPTGPTGTTPKPWSKALARHWRSRETAKARLCIQRAESLSLRKMGYSRWHATVLFSWNRTQVARWHTDKIYHENNNGLSHCGIFPWPVALSLFRAMCSDN